MNVNETAYRIKNGLMREQLISWRIVEALITTESLLSRNISDKILERDDIRSELTKYAGYDEFKNK